MVGATWEGGGTEGQGGEPKTVLVTGANRGVGRALARELALHGHRVILHARTPARAQAAVEELSPLVGREALDPVAADLESPDEVDRAVQAIAARHESIGVLVNNAGVVLREFRRTQEGLETTLAVNHLGTVRWTLGLLPLLLADAGARILVLSSLAHARRHRPEVFASAGFDGGRAWAQTRFLNLAFAFHMARLLEGAAVSVHAVHPGTLPTRLLDEWASRAGVASPRRKGAGGLQRSSARKAAAHLSHAALTPELADRTGLFLRKGKELRVRGVARDPGVQERVHEWTRELTGVSWREAAEEALTRALA